MKLLSFLVWLLLRREEPGRPAWQVEMEQADRLEATAVKRLMKSRPRDGRR